MSRPRVAVLWASPENLPGVGADEELRAIKALDLDLDPYPAFDLTSFRGVWRAPPEVLHISAHGWDQGLITHSRSITREQLLAAVRLTTPRPRLVFLNACASAGHAQALAGLGLAAVGVEGEVDPQAARTVAAVFYAEWLRKEPLALCLARAELQAGLSGRYRLYGAEHVPPPVARRAPTAEDRHRFVCNLDRHLAWLSLLDQARAEGHRLMLLPIPPAQGPELFLYRVTRHTGHAVPGLRVHFFGPASPVEPVNSPAAWGELLAVATGHGHLHWREALAQELGKGPLLAVAGARAPLQLGRGGLSEDQAQGLAEWLELLPRQLPTGRQGLKLLLPVLKPRRLLGEDPLWKRLHAAARAAHAAGLPHKVLAELALPHWDDVREELDQLALDRGLTLEEPQWSALKQAWAAATGARKATFHSAAEALAQAVPPELLLPLEAQEPRR